MKIVKSLSCLYLITLILFTTHQTSAQSEWTIAGGGCNQTVFCIEKTTGGLYLGGGFTQAGSTPANKIVKWNGSGWETLGAGIDPSLHGEVLAIAEYQGEVYAGGYNVVMAGGVAVNGIARYSSANGWQAVGTGLNVDGVAGAMAVYGGELYVGGDFDTAGGVAVHNIAKWNGTIWSDVGGGITSSNPDEYIEEMKVINNILHVGGAFSTAGSISAENIATWNGTAWSALGAGLNSTVRALGFFNNELYAGGSFEESGGSPVRHLAKWDGTIWTAVGTGTNNRVDVLYTYDNLLYVGGAFSEADGQPANYLATWNGTTWTDVGTGLEEPFGPGVVSVYAMADLGSDFYVGGSFCATEGPVSGPNCSFAGKDINVGNMELTMLSEFVQVFHDPATETTTVTIAQELFSHEQFTFYLYDIKGVEAKAVSLTAANSMIPLDRSGKGIFLYSVRGNNSGLIKQGKVVIP